MSAAQFMKYVLVIAGIAALIKGIMLLVWPATFRRVVNWWLGLPVQFLRTLGAMMIALGILCVGVAALHIGNWLLAATSILGTFLILGGFVYQVPSMMRHAMPVIFGSALLTRIWGVLALLIAGALLLIVLR